MADDTSWMPDAPPPIEIRAKSSPTPSHPVPSSPFATGPNPFLTQPTAFIHRHDSNQHEHHRVQVFAHLDKTLTWIIPAEIRDGDLLRFDPDPVSEHAYRCYDTYGGVHRLMWSYRPGDDVDFLRNPWSWPAPRRTWTLDDVLSYPDFTPNCSDIGPVNDHYFKMKGEMDLSRTQNGQDEVESNPDPFAVDDPVVTRPVDPAPTRNASRSVNPYLGPVDSSQPLPSISEIRAYLDAEAADETVLWWLRTAFREAQSTVHKAREYGSIELIYAGRVMAQIHNRLDEKTLTDAQAAELQIFQYVLGKLGRWTAAIRRGEWVSDDSLFDIGVYVRMVQRLRSKGQWP